MGIKVRVRVGLGLGLYKYKYKVNQNIQIFLFRLFLHFVLDPYEDCSFLKLNVFSFKKLTLAWSFVRSIVTNLVKLSNINVSQNDNIRLFLLILIKSLPFFNDNQAFLSKMIGFWAGSKHQNVELICIIHLMPVTVIGYQLKGC